MKNPVRAKLLGRERCIGSWMQIGHPAIAEMLGHLGFDWIGIDCEHTDIGPAEVAAISRGLRGTGTLPLVRVRENDTLAIRQALDLGAYGVIVPLVNSAEEARRAVAAARFPPAGVRGFAHFRANDYGADFDEYARTANDEVTVITMVESKDCVEHIDEILAVDGVDGVFVGPYDLSGSYGVPGQTQHDLVIMARERVLEACIAAGKSAGLHIVTPTPEVIATAIATGFTFLALGMDTVFVRDGAAKALGLAAGSIVTNDGTAEADTSRGSESP